MDSYGEKYFYNQRPKLDEETFVSRWWGDNDLYTSSNVKKAMP